MMPIGGIVGSKQVLAALKRKGLIYDYSPWGYLEGCWVNVQYSDHVYRGLEELFPDGDAPRDTDHIEMTEEEWDECYIGGTISYLGCTFDTKHLDGCFKPYLQLTSRDGDYTQTSAPRICMWGAIG